MDEVIGAPLACFQCRRPVVGSVSDDFCSEDCETGWLAARCEPSPVDNGQGPDPTVPEVMPDRPLATFLGDPPAGAVVRNGDGVLDDVAAFVARFNVFPHEHCVPVLALWHAHTHAVSHFYVTPRLILDSAEPGSGKTRVLEVAALLCAAPEMTISATSAALFRMVSAGPISILFDEVDAVFNPKTGGSSEDLRGLLNAGYKNGATVARCVGDAKAMKVQRFPVFAPAALAGIAGGMPATITTRAITIHMRKRRHNEHVDQFRQKIVEREAAPLRDALAAWVGSVAEQVGEAAPVLPDGVTDRSAEIWEPLLAIADAAGGHWPNTARAACEHFVLHTAQEDTSPGVTLLADLRAIFTRHNTDRLPTKALLADLTAIEESPWGEFEGKPLDSRRMARELARFSIRPTAFKNDEGTVKGYVTYPTKEQVGLTDAWDRYLKPLTTEDGGA
ncbi:MAG: DUF3631 domain-containing protein [Actinomycetota bacterium]|nr:DUF3631 domain-containing protein [Actinomycetota bacterium]